MLTELKLGGCMRIVIIGAGAIGLLLANRLAQSQTVAIVARPKLAPLLQSQGVLVSLAGETFAAKQIAIVTEQTELEPEPDLVILSVKSYDTASALPLIAALRP